jgi:hypothetical protein
MQKRGGSTLDRSMIPMTSGQLSHLLDWSVCWLGGPLSQHSARQALVAARDPVLVQCLLTLGFEDDAGFA